MSTTLASLLRAVARNNGSDLHIKAGVAPRVRINGQLRPLKVDGCPSPEQVEEWVLGSMDETTRELFTEEHEADYAVTVRDRDGTELRFRSNAFLASGNICFTARLLGGGPRTLTDLGLPQVASTLASHARGLVLVTGPTGSGKTTTLAAMVNQINEREAVHILTLEDPVEVVHHDKRAVVNQRELRHDTAGWRSGLRSALRQDPDVLLLGEMRDTETVRTALSAAQTGHLVLSTLHTTRASEAVNRVVDFFPPHEQRQVRWTLAEVLRGVLCQRLVTGVTGERVVVVESLVNTIGVEEVIRNPDVGDLTDLIRKGEQHGMQSFDQYLVGLVQRGVVGLPQARSAASSPHDLAVELRRAGIKGPGMDGW